MTVREQTILGGLALAIIVGAVTLFYLRPAQQGEVVAIEEQAKPLPATMVPAPAVQGPAQAPPPKMPATAPAPAAGPSAIPAPSATEVAPAQAAAAMPAMIQETPPESALITVAVEGAVVSPGIYELPSKSRVHHLLAAAEGVQLEADLSNINRVALLMDGTTLTIPWQPEVQRGDGTLRVRRAAPVYNPPQYTKRGAAVIPAPAPAETTENSLAAPAYAADTNAVGSGLININTASQLELESLPGIGPVLASKIVAHRTHRPFNSVEDLQEVAGIGEKRLAALRSFVTVE